MGNQVERSDFTGVRAQSKEQESLRGHVEGWKKFIIKEGDFQASAKSQGSSIKVYGGKNVEDEVLGERSHQKRYQKKNDKGERWWWGV